METRPATNPRSQTELTDLAVVVIGRNEGERLERCLRSVVGATHRVVYVDSGSTDASVGLAKSIGSEVVELDTSIPFTAGRARNAGLRRLQVMDRPPIFVQFVDGDTKIVDGWLPLARKFLRDHHDVAIVCGHCRELRPEASVYNRLCDIEWSAPAGETTSCGGIFMARVADLAEVGAFDAAITAGEEPELCFRLRSRGARIWRLAVDMARHDAGITRFAQWWTRQVRTGHAYAEVGWRHARTTERFRRREIQSIVFWALVYPLAVGALPFCASPWFLFLLTAYPLQALRVYCNIRVSGRGVGESALFSVFCIMAKFAQLVGLFRFAWRAMRGKPRRLIEYR